MKYITRRQPARGTAESEGKAEPRVLDFSSPEPAEAVMTLGNVALRVLPGPQHTPEQVARARAGERAFITAANARSDSGRDPHQGALESNYDEFETAVQQKYRDLSAYERAKEIYRREQDPGKYIPMVRAREYTAPEFTWRLDGLAHVGANILIPAEQKTGKTTLSARLSESLLNGNAFLGEYQVATPLTGALLYVNLELDPAMFNDWFEHIGILGHDRFFVQHLRGQHGMKVHSDAWCEQFVKDCAAHGVEAVIFDTAGAMMTSAGVDDENSNNEVRALTDRLNSIKAEAGIQDLYLPIHAKRDLNQKTPRPRGASAWGDWADGFMNLALSTPGDFRSPREFSAFGRYGDGVRPTRLHHDGLTRELSLIVAHHDGEKENEVEPIARTTAKGGRPSTPPEVIDKFLRQGIKDEYLSTDSSKRQVTKFLRECGVRSNDTRMLERYREVVQALDSAHDDA